MNNIEQAQEHLKEVKQQNRGKIIFSYCLWLASFYVLDFGIGSESDGVVGFSFVVWLVSFVLWRVGRNPIVQAHKRCRQAEEAHVEAQKLAEAQFVYDQQVEAWNRLTPEQQNLLMFEAMNQGSGKQQRGKTSGFLAFGDDPVTLAATGIASWFLIDKLANRDK